MWQFMSEVTLSDTPSSLTEAVEVWIKKPHVVNRQLCAAKITLHQDSYNPQTLPETCTQSHEDGVDELFVGRLQIEVKRIYDTYISKSIQNCDRTLRLYVRDLLPKSIDRHPVLREVVFFDTTRHTSYFIPIETVQPDKTVNQFQQDLGYKIELESEKLMLSVLGPEKAYDQGSGLGYTLRWLKDTLLPKLARWCTEKQLNTAITSLRLVPVDRYNHLYQTLKKKYGVPLVENWPEKTDPQKFVYEDVAISAYLLLLWEDDRRQKSITKKQSFVDLGCGNGLLVHILSSEGHPGLGLDIRKRKIWDMYGSDINLKEQAVLPSDENLFPEYDWLIGNHSDELTPWIPVMAARSSYNCNYFVLPCCPWDFNAKFSHKASGSQYKNYLNFVKEVGEACGFLVEEDTLRIPSTKRVCFVGRSRAYTEDNECIFDQQRQLYIDKRCKQNSSNSQCDLKNSESHFCKCVLQSDMESIQQNESETSKTIDTEKQSTENLKKDHEFACTKDNEKHACPMCGLLMRADNFSQSEESTNTSASRNFQSTIDTKKRKWVAEFQVRESIEKPRNCITVDSSIKDHITTTVFQSLLKMDGGEMVNPANQKIWRKGGSMPLADVAVMFDSETLQKLKSECGGLQTLLRNCHHVFRVQGGCVSLRDWNTDDYDVYKKQKKKKKGKPEDPQKHNKTKLCYFHDYHPDGCPMEADKCKFAHGVDELRKRPT